MARSIKIWSGTSWEDVGPALPSVNTQFIQLTNPASTGVTIRAAASQSANIFQVQNYAVTPLFTIDASGNVGIGTQTLTTASGYGSITLDGTNGSLWSAKVAGTETFRIQPTSVLTTINQIANTPLAFNTNNTERLRIDGSGNITIGNNLTVSGTTTLNGTISGTFSVGTSVQNADFNTLITSGIYRINNNNTNGPQTSGANDWGQVFVMRSAADTITQIYGDYTTGNLWTRSGNPTSIGGGGSWTSWHRIIDSYGGSLTTAQPTTTGTLRNIYTSTSGASGGNDGDVWLVYV